MTAQARHIVFRTDKADATEVDIERWAADVGCIVANMACSPAPSSRSPAAHRPMSPDSSTSRQERISDRRQS